MDTKSTEKPDYLYKPGMVNGDIILKLEERIKQLEEEVILQSDRIQQLKKDLKNLGSGFDKIVNGLEEENRKMKEALDKVKEISHDKIDIVNLSESSRSKLDRIFKITSL